jgi:hypothetical protein
MSLLSAIAGTIASSVVGLLRLLWNTLSIVIVLSVAATIPVLQFASLGYMLECSARIASGAPIRECFPGVALAGHIVRCSLWTFLTWLPIWLITDLGYSSELIQPGSSSAMWLRVVARVLSILWVLWIVWAIARGGSWKHFLWPRPIRFIKTVTSKNFWLDVEDRWWGLLKRLHLWRLIKLGFQASLGAWIWLAIPALMIWVSLNAASEVRPQQQGGLALLGLLGAILMARAIQYLPTLQTHMALEAHLRGAMHAATHWSPSSVSPGSVSSGWLHGVLNRKVARSVFRRVPLTYALSNILFLALALPLYLLRIESIPAQLWFLLSILFVVWMFPAKLLIGWLIRRSRQKTHDASWPWRSIAWIPHLAAIGVYVGFLYLGKFALWEGGAILLFQHAFLPPVPFFVR